MSAFALLLAIPLSMIPGDSITVEQVVAAYEQTFEVLVYPLGDDTLVTVVVSRELEDDNPLVDFEKDNEFFLTYLIGNAVSFNKSEILEAEAPIEKRKQSFYEALRSDESFNEALFTSFGRYLASQGNLLVGWNQAEGVRSVTESDLQRLAVRFFFPDAVTDEGRLSGHICVGINGLEDIEGDRDVLVEAFVYATIFRALRKERYGLDEEFRAALEAAQNLALSVDEETKILRAQGAVWALLARSENIRNMLRESYQMRETYLPFQIVR